MLQYIIMQKQDAITQTIEEFDSIMDVNLIIHKQDNEQEYKQIRNKFIWQCCISVLTIGASITTLVISGTPITAGVIASTVIGAVVGIHLPSPKIYD